MNEITIEFSDETIAELRQYAEDRDTSVQEVIEIFVWLSLPSAHDKRVNEYFANKTPVSIITETDAMSGRINPLHCEHCGLEVTPEGHDGCIGTLEGVMNACCGHGKPEAAYVQFDHSDYARQSNKVLISGSEAFAYIGKHSKFSAKQRRAQDSE